MSSLQAMQLLTAAARISREEKESFSKTEIAKKLQDIKYLSSQKKVPRLSLRKEIIHLENQLQGILELEERFARHKEKESIAVASLKQQLTTLKNKLRASEDQELGKKVEHLSFLLGEHLAKKEITGEVAALTQIETASSKEVAAKPAEGNKTEEATATPPESVIPAKESEEEKHFQGFKTAKKAAMLHRRLEALKEELSLHKELGKKSPKEMKQLEETVKAFEEKLQQYYERHPESMLQEVGTVEVPPNFEVKHKMIFPQAEVKEEKIEEAKEHSEEMREVQKQLPLPPPPRMRKKRD